MPAPEVLERDTRIEGLVFAAGTEVQHDHQGRALRGTLARKSQVKGVTLPAGTVVWLDRGTVVEARPPRRVEVGGFLAEREAAIRFPQPAVWETYELCLARPHRTGERTIAAGTFVEIRWNGKSERGRMVGRSELDRWMEEVGLESGCRSVSGGLHRP